MAIDLDFSANTMDPQKSLKHIAKAIAEGLDVKGFLLKRTGVTQLQGVVGSLASVRSGLRRWHAFSILVFGYEAKMSVPPREPSQVICWAASISNLGTACNYLG